MTGIFVLAQTGYVKLLPLVLTLPLTLTLTLTLPRTLTLTLPRTLPLTRRERLRPTEPQLHTLPSDH